MPLLNDLVPNESLLCKLWRIKEDENILDPEHELNPEDYQIFLKRKANHLRSQFLASRKLIGLINPDLRISYKEDIPILSDNKNISISHSDEIVTILISKENGIGVDVEKIKNKVHSVASKFLSSNEIGFFGKDPSTRQLIRAWTAKEAIYKALRKPGINFSDNIILDKFNDKAKSANAKFISSDQETTFKLYFYDLDDYCLTIAQESLMLCKQIIDFLFQQYSNYSLTHTLLELFAVFMNILSVIYAKRNSVLVYPTGLIGTGIFVYLLFNFSLLGDMIINFYFVIMSIYGWYYWTQKKEGKFINNVSRVSTNEYYFSIILAVISIISIYLVYDFFDKWNSWTAYIDTLTTAIFFVAMWLMARRKIESWTFWFIGDIITIPLYFYKGLTISSFQYLIFSILAILGYISWKKILSNSTQT